jgi:hypothetical protein
MLNNLATTLLGGLLVFTDLPPDTVWDGIDDWYIRNGTEHTERGPSPIPDPQFEERHPLLLEPARDFDPCDWGCGEEEDDHDDGLLE